MLSRRLTCYRHDMKNIQLPAAEIFGATLVEFDFGPPFGARGANGARSPRYGDELAPVDCPWNLWGGTSAGGPFGFIPSSPAPACESSLDSRTHEPLPDRPILWDLYQGVIIVP